MKPKSSIARILPGIIFLGGAVYLWGGLGLDPEGVAAVIANRPFAEVFFSFRLLFYTGITAAAAGTAFCILMRIRFPTGKSFSRRDAAIALCVLLFFTFPPQWLMGGLSAVSLGILLMLANAMGLAGTTLISISLGDVLGKKLPPLKTSSRKSRFLALIIAGGAFFTVLAIIQKLTLGGIPHVGDGVIQLLQARIFASGNFTVPAPEHIEFFFDPFLVTFEGRWFTQYPPGFAALLSLGTLAGIPQLVNPILAGLIFIFFGLILKELNLERGWMLIFALSPFVIFMSGSFMSHPAAMFFGAATLFCIIKSGRIQPGWLALAGLSAGLMFTVRPFTAFCFCLPLAIMTLGKRVGMGVLTGIGGLALGALPLFINNYCATGALFTTGYQLAWDGFSGLGFGDSPWGPPHSPQLGALHLAALLGGLNSRLFELPLPALAGVALWLALSMRKGWREWSLFAAGLCGIAGYLFYFYVDFAYGPRFAYASAFPLLLLSALGVKALYRRMRDEGVPRAAAQYRLIAAGVLLLAVWAAVSLPARVKEYSSGYRDVRADFIDNIRAHNISSAIVFLDDYPSSSRHARLYSLGFTNRQAWYYAWMLDDRAVEGALRSVGVSPEQGFGPAVPLNKIGAALNSYWGNPEYIPTPAEDTIREHIPLKQGLIYMSPFIGRNDIIFARDLGLRNQALMKQYPGMKYYRAGLADGKYIIREITSPE